MAVSAERREPDLGMSGGGVGVSAEDELAVHYKH